MKLISNNKRVRIIFQDNRIIEGLLLACDFHMNTIISKSVEYRLSKESKKWEKRKKENRDIYSCLTVKVVLSINIFSLVLLNLSLTKSYFYKNSY